MNDTLDGINLNIAETYQINARVNGAINKVTVVPPKNTRAWVFWADGVNASLISSTELIPYAIDKI